MRFGASKEEEGPQDPLHPIFDSFPSGCVGQYLLFCKEAGEKPIGQSAKNENPLFSEPPFLRRAKV